MDLQAFGRVAMNLKTALPQGGLDLLHYRRVTRLALFLAGRRGKHTQGQKAQALAIEDDGHVDMSAVHVMAIGAENILQLLLSPRVTQAEKPDAQPARQGSEKPQATAVGFVTPGYQQLHGARQSRLDLKQLGEDPGIYRDL